MHRLVVIGSLTENVQLVRKAKARGYYTIVCDGYKNGPAKKEADKSYDIDVRDTDAIASMCREEKADGIIGSFSDLILEQITRIAARAGLKWYLKPEQIPQYREKNVAKDILRKLDVRTPDYVLLSGNFRDEELDGLRYPLVVKPVNGWGSKGIFVAHSIEDIRNGFEEAASRQTMNELEAEEYSRGREYNMMTWVIDGQVHVISIADREKNPQEGDRIPLLNRIVYPARDIRKVCGEATEVLRKFISVTGQKNGALCMQFFYNEGGVEVCEIAGRLFGYEHEMVTICSGFDIEDMLLNYVYDENALEKMFCGHTPCFTKCCEGIYFVGKQGRTIKDQRVADELAEDPHVLEAIKYYRDGEKIDNYGPNPYLVRYYIAAESRQELDRIAAEFFEKMYIEDTEGENCCERFWLEQ